MRNANPFKAGLFILTALALAIAVFFGIAGSSIALGPTRDYTIDFALSEDVSGLAAGNDVRVGGVKAGTVRSVEVFSAPGTTQPVVRAVFRVPDRYVLRDGAKVAVQNGLTGLVNLNVSDLGQGNAIPSGTPIAGLGSPLNQTIAALGEASPEIAGIMKDVRSVTLPKVNLLADNTNSAIDGTKATIDQIKTAARSADDTIQHVKSKIDPSVERYNKVADTAASALGHLDEVLGDGKSDLRTTIANLKSVTQTANEKLGPIADKIAGAVDSVKGTVDEARGSLGDVKKTVENTREATASVRGILANNRSRIDEIVKDLGTTSSNLGFASSEIRRSPWRLLYKPGNDEVANQNLYDSARQFAEGAASMQDSAAALRDMLADPNADPKKVQALVDELNASFAKFQTVEKTLWEQVKK
jgi:ABC-type transporter Mla subunit MlaD